MKLSKILNAFELFFYPCFYHDMWRNTNFFQTLFNPCVDNSEYIILKFLYFSALDNNWYLLKQWNIEVKPARDRAYVNAGSPYIPRNQDW